MRVVLQNIHARLVENGPRTLFEYLLYGGLWPLSCFYGLIVRIRRFFYRRGLKSVYKASVPVIAVGNLTAGGTGKTPMTDFLLKRLAKRAVKAAVVSRGYGGRFQGEVGCVADFDGKIVMRPELCGDEPYLLAQRNPGAAVYVAPVRRDGVARAEQDGAEIILLDDAFQHLAVARDLNILLLDAQAPFGNGHLLPAGNLREPLSATDDADLVVLTRADNEVNLESDFEQPVLRCRHALGQELIDRDGSRLTFKEAAGQKCLAFAGIARPDNFFSALRDAGMTSLTEIPLVDHQVYHSEIVEMLKKACHNHSLIVTTEKDAVKLQEIDFPIPCYRVGVDLVFEDSDDLDKKISEILESKS